jgi:hypothetical protein
MTLAVGSRNDYVSLGNTADFDYSFKIFSQTHLLVTVRSPAGVETTLTLTTDYSVDGVGNPAGGQITLVAGKDWMTDGFLTIGWAITIIRFLPLTQEADIRNQGEFYPETHEDVFDRITMLIQQLNELLGRSVVNAITVNQQITLPPPVPGQYLSWLDEATLVNGDARGPKGDKGDKGDMDEALVLMIAGVFENTENKASFNLGY